MSKLFKNGINSNQGSIKKLRDNFFELFEELHCSTGQIQEVFDKLVKNYSTNDRCYHNLEHINIFLNDLNEYQHMTKDLNTIQMAVWFHDVIYDTKSFDNEDKSASYAIKTLKELNVLPEIINQVEILILATKKHEPLSENIDLRLFLDCDLLILGASEKVYDRYAESIRREYSWVSEQKYRDGRISILENFLQREKIYLTSDIYKTFEAQARFNIARELIKLK